MSAYERIHNQPVEFKPLVLDVECHIYGSRQWQAMGIYDRDGLAQILHYDNTTIRNFKDETFDHVEVRFDDGQLMALGGAALEVALHDMDFPFSWQPEVDPQTLEWYTTVGREAIDSFLDDFE